MIQLVEIDADNWRTPLAVAESQRTYVASRGVLLARAYAYRKARSQAFFVCHDGIPVGMGLVYDDEQCYVFSQFFIDARYQGQGYGTAAAKLILDQMRQDGRYNKVVLCCVADNVQAIGFYQKLGFVETGREGEEIIMELSWGEAGSGQGRARP